MKKNTVITTLIALVIIAGVVYWLHERVKSEVQTIRIGAVLPLTGNMASLGETGKNGLAIAQDYINQNHILKDGQIEFVLGDGMGIPKSSINALNYIVDIEKINIVLSIVSAVDFAFIPIQANKKFLFVSHATHPALSNVNDLVFRHSPTVLQEAELMQSYIGADSLSTVLLCMSDDYGTAFSSIVQEKGIIPAKSIMSFNADERDYKTLCLKAIHANPSRIVLCGNGKEQYKIVSALRELNYNSEIVTTLGFKVGGAYDVVKDKVDFAYVNFKNTEVDQRYAQVLLDYKSKYNKEMTLNEMIFFNTALLIVEAINQTKDKNDVNEIANHLSNIRTFEGIGENIIVTSSNDILPELGIYKNNK